MLSFYVNPGEWCYLSIYQCVCVCVCVCVPYLSLCLVNIAGECREARDFASQEVCSHARAGVLA